MNHGAWWICLCQIKSGNAMTEDIYGIFYWCDEAIFNNVIYKTTPHNIIRTYNIYAVSVYRPNTYCNIFDVLGTIFFHRPSSGRLGGQSSMLIQPYRYLHTDSLNKSVTASLIFGSLQNLHILILRQLLTQPWSRLEPAVVGNDLHVAANDQLIMHAYRVYVYDPIHGRLDKKGQGNILQYDIIR